MTNHSGGNIQAVNIYLSPDIHGSFLNKTLQQWALQAFVEKWVKRWIFTVVWCRNPHININHLNSQFMKYWFIVLPYMSESVSVFSVISAFSHIEVKNAAFAGIQLCHFFYTPHSPFHCELLLVFKAVSVHEYTWDQVFCFYNNKNHYRTAYKGKTRN